jgi:tetratricopeptide (TPR) repeat protein
MVKTRCRKLRGNRRRSMNERPIRKIKRNCFTGGTKEEEEEMEKIYKENKKKLGDDHPDTLKSLNNLANVFTKNGEYDRALPLYEECLAGRKRVLGDDNPDTLISLNNLAVLYEVMEEFDKALPIYEDCFKRHMRVLGKDNPDTNDALAAIKRCKMLLGRKGECSICLDKMNDYTQTTLGNEFRNYEETFYGCGHKFHRECGLKWIAAEAAAAARRGAAPNPKCPDCRQPMTASTQQVIKNKREALETAAETDLGNAAQRLFGADGGRRNPKYLKNKSNSKLRKRNQYSKKIKY